MRRYKQVNTWLSLHEDLNGEIWYTIEWGILFRKLHLKDRVEILEGPFRYEENQKRTVAVFVGREIERELVLFIEKGKPEIEKIIN